MHRIGWRVLAVLLAMALVAFACTEDDGDGDADGGGGDTTQPVAVDYEAVGLWDDGPCDESMDPLNIGIMVVFESPVISLEDQALALEASADAFNERGGANGACIEVTACDDGADTNQSVACVREFEDAGVVTTVNDQATAGQAEVRAAINEAGIPRIAANPTPDDWDDPMLYPTDAGGTGVTFLQPKALIEEGLTDIGLIRVDLAEASALTGFLEDIYGDQASFVADVPVAAGTTDYSQFVLAVQDAGADSASLSLGEQEAIQVVDAAQQLGSDLELGNSLGTFAQSNIADLGEFGDQMIFLGSFAPATVDIPVYEALRQDLADSGEDALQPANLKTSPMRSWIGLYALLYMIRDADLTEFTPEAITAMLDEAQDVPMLDMFGGADWTPNADHPGIFARAGIDDWTVYRWDSTAEAPDGLEGNFVASTSFSFDETMCDSPLGGPC